jgi:general secretion pathway protein G
MDKKAKPGSPSFLFLLFVGLILWIVLMIFSQGPYSRNQHSRFDQARTDLDSLRTALRMFQQNNGFFPSDAEGLRALWLPPKRATNWRGPYIANEEGLMDPWHHPYVYKYPGPTSPDGFSVISWGPDGKPGGGDDVDLAGR